MSVPPTDVLLHVVDAHAHPTDDPALDPATLSPLPHTLCAMSSNATDQSKVRALAAAHPDSIVPAFGYHPWWAHKISISAHADVESHYRALFLSQSTPALEGAFTRLLPALPTPMPLAQILSELRDNLSAFPAAMLGEVGIDRAARIPYPPADPSDDRRELSPFVTPLTHQLAILEAQLALAVELRRNVSLHSVKAPSQTRELLDRMAERHGAAWLAISIDLHSCGLSPEVWREIEKRHPNAYISLSTAINARSANHIALIRAAQPSRILVESDYPEAQASASRTWDMILTVAQTRGWRVEEAWDYEDDNSSDQDQWGVVRRLEHNWSAFVKGGHVPPKKEKLRKGRKDYSYDVWESGDEGDE
ncbi:Metallo-dependent hydrolase [Artomyces pyxidatus]|uniref:Metallo-dependent hydrolase n=1 Tax=Artomyces pyxidatus TaxID=48021 RepID=A0ACB8SSL1_9AGAM|nr:Metallo-dependent hydrolase [Artomyces pyxidatus]